MNKVLNLTNANPPTIINLANICFIVREENVVKFASSNSMSTQVFENVEQAEACYNMAAKILEL